MSEQEATLDEFVETNEPPTGERIETPIGVLPSDWAVEWLDDICSINPDGFSEDDWPDESFEYISLSDVSEGTILQSETIPVDDAPSRAQRGVKEGDVLVGTVRPKQVSHGIVIEEHDGKICSSGFGVLRSPTNLNPIYLLQEVLSRRFFRQMEAYVAGSGYPAVNIGDLRKHRIAVPSLVEQRKIASVLYTVGQAIHKTEELVSQLKQLKQGVAQELFRYGAFSHDSYQETIIGQIPQSWKLTKLEDLVDLKNGLNFSSDQKGSGTLLANVPNVYGSIEIEPSELARVDISESEIEKYELHNGDIITVRSSKDADGVGQVAIYRGSEEPVVFAGFTIRQRPNKELILPEYLIQYLRYPETRKRVVALGREVALTNVSQGDLAKIDIPVPPQNEQQEIIAILSDFDGNISKEQQYIDRLIRLKHGLMQDLLSGEVRTHDKDLELIEDVLQHG